MTSRLGLYLSIAQAEPWLLGKPLDLPFQVFIKRWAIPGLYFLIFVLSIVRLVDKILPMSGFEPQISGVRSNHSTNWATTNNHCPPLQVDHIIPEVYCVHVTVVTWQGLGHQGRGIGAWGHLARQLTGNDLPGATSVGHTVPGDDRLSVGPGRLVARNRGVLVVRGVPVGPISLHQPAVGLGLAGGSGLKVSVAVETWQIETRWRTG